jgi:hypothetical protein
MKDGANRFPAVPCFRVVARLATVKLCGQKSFVFIVLLKAQPLACGRDEANLAGNPEELSREKMRA